MQHLESSRPKSQNAQSQHKLAACKYSLQRLVCFQSQNQVGHMTHMTNPENSLSSSLRTFPSSHGQGQRYALIASTFWCHHQVKRINAWWASFPAHPVAMASGLQVGTLGDKPEGTLILLHSTQSRFTGPTAARCHFSFWDLSFTISNLEDRWGQQISALEDVGDRLVWPSGRSDCG